jgi:hypothetical protein
MIRLSIVIPSNRDSLTAVSRILQACSWAGPRVEIVVRDGSGSAAKAACLRGIERENCRIVVAPPCDARENRRQAFALAQGDFVYMLSDDDVCFDRALTMLPGVIESVVADRTVIGVAAPVLIENTQGTQAFAYPNIDADDPLVRLSGYLSAERRNLLAASPIRRTTMARAREVIDSKPFAFPFDDQILSLLYLLTGKFGRMKRLMYIDNTDDGDTAGAAAQRDADVYKASALDPATNKLHWFLCGFEGATLIRNMAIEPDYAPAQRQALADLWFSTMFNSFKLQPRNDAGSPLGGEAEKLCARWREAAGQLSFADMLADICQFLALSSQENALKYFAFWSTILGLRRAPAA